MRPDLTQEDHVEGLPLGTRGGALLSYTFPRDGEYEIQIRLTRDRNEEVEGLREAHEVEVLLDRERVKTFMPSATGVAQAGIGFGAFSISTRHMRQLAAIVSFSW